MGELIRKIGQINLKDKILEIEENESNSDENIIHIQSKDFRCEFSETEFFKILSLIIIARNKFEIIKKK